MTDKTEAQRLADVLRGFRSLDCHQAAAELLRLEAYNAALRDAADNALNTLIGCCVSAGGVDDRKTILETQAMLRAALSGTAPARVPLTDAALYLHSLVKALDGAFISTWQSTHAWQTELDEAREYLAAHNITGDAA